MDDAEPSSKPSLMRRTRSGVLWVGVVMIGSKVLSVATTLILARLLAPNDFGLVAASGIVISALALFTDLGFGAAIIHSRANRQRMASTAFFILPVIGLGLYVLAFASAPTLAHLLGSPGAATIMRIVAVNIVLSSLTIVPSVLLEKDMAYRRKVIPDLVPTIVYIPVTLTLAAGLHWGAYSMAWGMVAMAVTSLVLNWVVSGWRPSPVFDWAVARDLTRYGRNVLGGSLVAYLATNLDNAFVSRAVGTAGLGYYTLAYSIANLPADDALIPGCLTGAGP